MEDIGAINAFVHAAQLRSFTAAAKLLGLTPSGVGKSVSRLETSLGVRLLNRTTRRIGLTDDGAVFFEHCRRILDDLEAARALMTKRGRAPRGRLRVSLPETIGRRVVVPELPRFVEAHPEVDLELNLSDHQVNLVETGVDVAIRIGHLVDSSLVARPVGQQQIITIAPRALVDRDPIRSLGDLALHRCLSFRIPTTGRVRGWTFRVKRKHLEWRPRSFMILDEGEALVAAVEAGLGVTQVPSYMAADALTRGTVTEVLADKRSRPVAIHAVYASRRNLPARTRAFIDFVTGLRGLEPQPLPG
jgi:DNA-binding transcriptional LysR family regulator